MARWTVEEPTTLDFDGVVAVKAGLVSGVISLLATSERPAVHVSEIEGQQPLIVTHEAGMLTIAHGGSGWEGALNWLRNTRSRATVTVMVPRECPVSLNLVTANAVVTGLDGRISVKTGSGDVTLDGVTGTIDANTVSGAIEAQGVGGAIRFNSVSGDLAVAGGSIDRLAAHSISGTVAADVSLRPGGTVQVNTVSGEVSLRLPESVSVSVSLTSAAGGVNTAFPELGQAKRGIGKAVTGTLGSGSGTLGVTTVSGAITLLSRPFADEGEDRP